MWSLALELVTGPKKWLVIGIAAAVLVAIAGGYIGWLKLDIAGLERDIAGVRADLKTTSDNLAKAVETNDANQVALDRLQLDSTAIRKAFAGELAAAESRCTQTRIIKREVSRVAAESPAVCPVAPSVRAALDGLQPASSADHHEDRARPGPPAR